MISRRNALKTALLTLASGVTVGRLTRLAAQAPPAATPSPGPFKLPPLPYAVDALEPHIDARTMEIHHDKHHAAYVANLNKAVADYPDLARVPIEELVQGLVRNQGGGHFNHTLFWQMMAKNGGGEPKGDLGQALGEQFKTFTAFKEEFTKAALGQFGSGWAWLTLDPTKKLRVEASANQDNPLTQRRVPLLGLDVWEHAYYLKYQNRRPEYVAAFFNVINWDYVAERYAKARG
jgi:Fe-Mn family superoxide dismutase